MSARNNDEDRIREIYRVVQETLELFASENPESLRNPHKGEDLLKADGLAMRVLRVGEEMGRLSREAEAYGFYGIAEAAEMRNIIAHAYWSIDRSVVVDTVVHDFPALLQACTNYADAYGFEFD